MFISQSHTLATDGSCNQMKAMYLKHHGLGGAGGSLGTEDSRAAQEAAYHKEAETQLAEDNLYKIYFVSSP